MHRSPVLCCPADPLAHRGGPAGSVLPQPQPSHRPRQRGDPELRTFDLLNGTSCVPDRSRAAIMPCMPILACGCRGRKSSRRVRRPSCRCERRRHQRSRALRLALIPRSFISINSDGLGAELRAAGVAGRHAASIGAVPVTHSRQHGRFHRILSAAPDPHRPASAIVAAAIPWAAPAWS